MTKLEDSAVYFLVWHCGMSVDGARDAIQQDRSSIRPLARAGKYEFNRCANALCDWIDGEPK